MHTNTLYPSWHLNSCSAKSAEDDPLYDSVCSEDDYCLVEQLERLSLQQAALRRDGGTPLDQDYQEVVSIYLVKASNRDYKVNPCQCDQIKRRNAACRVLSQRKIAWKSIEQFTLLNPSVIFGLRHLFSRNPHVYIVGKLIQLSYPPSSDTPFTYI